MASVKQKKLVQLVTLLGSFLRTASFLLRTRWFGISTGPNIGDTFWSSLRKMGGWEKKCNKYLKKVAKTQTKVGFTKQGVPVSFHQSKHVLG